MKFQVLSFELPKSSWATKVLESYLKKISFFQKIEITWLKSGLRGGGNLGAEKKNKDSEVLKKNFDMDALIFVFDESGKDYSSIQFSDLLQKGLLSGKKKIQFIVGGPFGFNEDIKKLAHHKIRLSHFVLNQEVALVVLAEQIFRALTILKNHPYHNE
jgi:23S rRNA (pseudouridine1915-N3)-methyltransferase